VKTFYLFRHGQTYYSKNEIPYGTNEHTADILDEARPPIEQIGQFLSTVPIDTAFRSELRRCEQTAHIIESTVQFRFTPTPLCNEFMEDSFEAFYKRMQTLTEMLEKASGDGIAVCTHGAVIAALKKMLLGQEFGAHDLMYYPKTGVVVKVSEGKLLELDFNK